MMKMMIMIIKIITTIITLRHEVLLQQLVYICG